MLRHRSYSSVPIPASTAPLTKVVNVGGATGSMSNPPYSHATLECTEVRSFVDEVRVPGRFDKNCDSYRRWCEPVTTGDISYATASVGHPSPWTTYSVWTGKIGLWKRWWDEPIGASPSGLTFGEMAYPVKGLPPLMDSSGQGTFIIRRPDEVDSCIAKSLNSMLPAIHAEMSGLNSLFEMKDVLSLKKIIDALARVRKRLHSFVGLSRRKRGTLRDLLSLASNAHLVKSFAVDPFMSDISAVMKIAEEVDRKISYLLAEEGRVLKRHFSMPLKTLTGLSQLSSNFTSSNGMSFYLRRDVRFVRPRFNATVTYSYKLSQFEREHARVLGLLDAFGANWTPQIIWNAIPFSFVVDWFVKIENWLGNFKLNNIEPVTELYSFVWSISGRREIKLGFQPNSLNQLAIAPDLVWTHVVNEDFYKRVSERRVNMYRELEVSGLSLKELSLALALKFG